jgi:hypothetical protein
MNKKHREFILVGFSAAARAVFGNMVTQPPLTMKMTMADFIDAEVADGNWPQDEYQFYSLDTQANSLQGWRGVANGTAVNAPTWNTLEGFLFNGSTQYVDTNFAPSVDGINFVQNDGLLGCYILDNLEVGGTHALFGGRDSGALKRTQSFQSGQINASINSDGGLIHTGETIYADTSLYVVGRLDSANEKLYKNGVNIETDAVTSSGLTGSNIYVGAINDGTPAAIVHINAKIIDFRIGPNIGFNHAAHNTNLNIFLTALGII